MALSRDDSRIDVLNAAGALSRRTIEGLASVFRLEGQPAPKNAKFLQIFRAEFKTQPSRLLIAPMEPADHEMYRAAIHGDLEAFELVIRK